MRFVTRNNKILKLILRGSLISGCLLSFFAGCAWLNKPIQIKTTADKGYQLIVQGKPFLIKAVAYNPCPIGKGYDYDFTADPAKPWLIDGQLIKDAGFNCVRIYSCGKDLAKTKQFIADMYQKFGIYTIVSDWIGLWETCSLKYHEPAFCQRTKQQMIKIVKELKDTPGVLLWNLGNENNYTFSGKIGYWTSQEIEKITDPAKKIEKKAQVYYQLIDDIAKEIKKIDPIHPVALGNGEASFLNIAAKVCKNIDVLSIIIYRGKNFGNLFTTIRSTFDKPMFVSEFGCDSYDAQKQIEDQDIQAKFIVSQWQDLYSKTVASGNNSGNCLGGVVFEWTDEWWKHNEGYTADWSVHNPEAGWSNGSYYFDIRVEGNMNMNEEWLGIVSLSPEIVNNLNKRVPKKSYYAIKEFLSNPTVAKK